jgi:hypothetical protein
MQEWRLESEAHQDLDDQYENSHLIQGGMHSPLKIGHMFMALSRFGVVPSVSGEGKGEEVTNR